MKTLTSIRELGAGDLHALIAAASSFRDDLSARRPVERSLEGLCVANVFFEPSTRTRLSFDLAAQRLGAHVITFNPGTASTAKGESLEDTLVTLAAIGADVLVVRHGADGVPQLAADLTGLPVVNAGDGSNEHPTQTLLDLVTLQRHFGTLDGLRLALVGDISSSRVAGSLVQALPLLGVEVTMVGPDHMVPADSGFATTTDLDEILDRTEVVYLLRVQSERGTVAGEDYVNRFRLDGRRAARMNDAAVVMHPGPINRGIEVTDDVAESGRSLIREQVENGVPTRMAVLEAVAS